MSEELDKALASIEKNIDAWDEKPTRELASQLQMQLSILKLLVGIDRFDELPAFARYLKETTTFMDNCLKKKEN